MNFNHPTRLNNRSYHEQGFERIQALLLILILLLMGMLIGPMLLKKMNAERDLRIKILLRSFHTASEAYRQHHTTEGYAKDIEGLVASSEKVRYLGDQWRQPKLEGFLMIYQTPEMLPRASFSLIAERSDSLLGPPAVFCIDQKGILRTVAHDPADEGLLEGTDSGCLGGIEVV